MATLFNTKIKDTYQSLLKLEDNTILTTTTKNVTDGLGNASPLYMSTTRVGIGTNAPVSTLNVLGLSTFIGASGSTLGSTTAGAAAQFYQNGFSALLAIGGFANNGAELQTYTNGGITLGGTNIYLQRQSGNVLIGGTTGAGKLTVQGTGSSSATTSLLVQNSSGTEAFKVTDDRTTTISGTQTNLSTTNVYVGALSLTSAGVGATGQGIWSTGTDGQMVLAGSLGGFVIKGWAGYTVSLINNSNPRNLFSIQQYGFSDGNTSGLTGNTMNITPIYNFTGAHSSATVRGIYYNPTLTSLVNTNHIAIETVTGNVLLGTTSGNVGIGTSTPTEKLDLAGNFKLSGNIVLGDAAGGSGGGFQVYKNSNVYTYSLVHSQSHRIYLFANPQVSIYDGFPGQSTGIRTLGKLLFMPDGATAVTMLTNGNVLIGTTTDAGQKLQVNGSVLASSLNLSQGTITAGQLDLLYPNNIRYQSAYTLSIIPKDNSGNSLNTGGNIAILGDTVGLLHGNSLFLSFATLSNTGDTIKIKRALGAGHIPLYLAIEGSDASAYNYGTRSGSVLIYPGEQSNGNGYGNVILAHSGTAARGNVGVGEASPTARLQVKGSGSTSATTSLLVQNSLNNVALTVKDDLSVTFGSGVTLNNGITILNSGAPNDITINGYTSLMRLNASSSIGYFDFFRGLGYSQISSINEPIRYNAPTHLFGGTTNVGSAIVNIESTTQGFLPPRMTTAQKNAIATPATGLMVYDTDLARPCFFNGATWITL
jgi:hypothetical protein